MDSSVVCVTFSSVLSVVFTATVSLSDPPANSPPIFEKKTTAAATTRIAAKTPNTENSFSIPVDSASSDSCLCFKMPFLEGYSSRAGFASILFRDIFPFLISRDSSWGISLLPVIISSSCLLIGLVSERGSDSSFSSKEGSMTPTVGSSELSNDLLRSLITLAIF